MECSASKERVVARVAHHWRTHICQAALRLPTKARAILQRFNLFARDLQRGLGLIGLRSPLSKRAAWHARPRRGASLRAAFVAFRGKTNAVSGLGLSAGATRRTSAADRTSDAALRRASSRMVEPTLALRRARIIPGWSGDAFCPSLRRLSQLTRTRNAKSVGPGTAGTAATAARRAPPARAATAGVSNGSDCSMSAARALRVAEATKPLSLMAARQTSASE